MDFLEFGSAHILKEPAGEIEIIFEKRPLEAPHQAEFAVCNDTPFETSVGTSHPESQAQKEGEVQIPVNKKNTNTFTFKMEKLSKAALELNQLPKMKQCCNEKCNAVISDVKVQESKKTKKNKKVKGSIWHCKFCGKENKSVVTSGPDVLFCEKGSGMPNMSAVGGVPKIIVMIDTSASMNNGTRTQWRRLSPQVKEFWMKDAKAAEFKHQAIIAELGSLDNITDDTIINCSRLQSIKAAILTFLQELAEQYPNTRVGLITFDKLVYIHGDGRIQTELTKELLDKDSDLYEVGRKHCKNLEPISSSLKRLKDKIKQLKTDSFTALAPALRVAIGMADNAPCTKIILCTDGLSNVGVGKIDGDKPSNIQKYYDGLTEFAKDKRVSISLMSFDNCGMKYLGQAAKDTGGIVDKIAPSEADSMLRRELKRQIIATNAKFTVIAKEGVHVNVCGSPGEKENVQPRNKSTFYIGNILNDGEICVNFHLLDNSPGQQQQQQQQKQLPHVVEREEEPMDTSTEGATSSASAAMEQEEEHAIKEETCSFQVQISYKDLNGRQYTRVLTTERPVTTEREVADKGMNTKVAVLGFLKRSEGKLKELNDLCVSAIDRNEFLMREAMTFQLEALNYMHDAVDTEMNDEVQKSCNTKLREFQFMMNKIATYKWMDKTKGGLTDDALKNLFNLTECDIFKNVPVKDN